MEASKPVHSVVLDASPLLINEPSISTLLAKAEKIYTVPSVISEVKDQNARARLETTVIPFLTIKSPSPASVEVITDFARRTGDLAALSKPDVQVLALAYELECQLNHGDWRLRRIPGQKGLNGSAPSTKEVVGPEISLADSESKETRQSPQASTGSTVDEALLRDNVADKAPSSRSDEGSPDTPVSEVANLNLGGATPSAAPDTETPDEAAKDQGPENTSEVESDELDSDGWITPSNFKKQQAKDHNGSVAPKAGTGMIQVATITNDFAMQNVLLQMNLNLLSSSMLRVRQLKSYILRCHACFEKTKDMTKQFCPRCGKPTLTRVACSTTVNGEFRMHLKKNMQWNTRGDRYSIPKPVSGTSNGKAGSGKGGGKGGWGQGLILAEDQKEYVQAMTHQNRRRERDLMDDDFLPGILTGDRARARGRPKVGPGKNVNSKKR